MSFELLKFRICNALSQGYSTVNDITVLLGVQKQSIGKALLILEKEDKIFWERGVKGSPGKIFLMVKFNEKCPCCGRVVE
jgi:hypothetical protein